MTQLEDNIKYRNIIKYLFIAITIICIYYYYVYAYVIHSIYIYHDTIFPLLMADDILHGNLLLKDWYSVTNSYIIYIYSCLLLPYSIFGFSEYMYIYYVAFTMLLISISIFLNVYKIDGKVNKYNIFLFICFILFFPLGIARFLSYVGHHIELYYLVFFSLFIISKLNDIKNKFLMHILLYILFVIILSYSFMYYTFLIPILLVIIYRNVYIKVSKQELLILCILLLAFISVKFVYWMVAINDGLVFGGSGLGKPNIIEYEGLTKKFFNYYLGNIMKLNNSYPFGKDIIHSVPYFAKLAVIIYIFYKLVFNLLKFSKEDFINQYLIISILIFSGLLIFTTIQERPRYYVILSLMMYMFLIRLNIFEAVKTKYYKINRKKYYTIIVIIFIISIFNLGSNFILPKHRNIDSIYDNEIAKVLKEKKLKYGLAYPQLGLIPSFYLGSNVNVGMVIGKDYNIPYTWADNIRWYEKYTNFILAMDSEVNRFIKTYGSPVEHIKLKNNIHYNGPYQYSYNGTNQVETKNNINIMIYDKDLTQYLLNNNFISTMRCSKKVEESYKIEILPKNSCNGPYIGWNPRPNLGSKNLILHKGIYEFRIIGDNVKYLDVDLYSNDFEKNQHRKIKMFDIVKNDKSINFKVKIEKRERNIEFVLYNNSNDKVYINEFYKKTIDK